MELVKNLNDILENAKRFDNYLQKGNYAEKEFALQKLIDGRCFVVIKNGDKYKFYPSRFIGYKNNSAEAYENALCTSAPLPNEETSRHDAALYTFDGRMSNKAINKILKCKCIKDYAMSEKFIDFCHSLGLKGSDKRKFWLEIIEEN